MQYFFTFLQNECQLVVFSQVNVGYLANEKNTLCQDVLNMRWQVDNFKKRNKEHKSPRYKESSTYHDIRDINMPHIHLVALIKIHTVICVIINSVRYILININITVCIHRKFFPLLLKASCMCVRVFVCSLYVHLMTDA